MKLKTEIVRVQRPGEPITVGGPRTVMTNAVDYYAVNGCSDEMRHDAAAAHALKRSIARLNPIYRECIYNEADELMRSWGFELDKVAP